MIIKSLLIKYSDKYSVASMEFVKYCDVFCRTFALRIFAMTFAELCST